METHRWYAIQTTAGHENKVRSLIQRKIEQDARPQPDRPIRFKLPRFSHQTIAPLVPLAVRRERLEQRGRIRVIDSHGRHRLRRRHADTGLR